jgi:transposase
VKSVSLLSRVQVELPSKGVIVRRTGRYKYVYKVHRIFRCKNGQPTNTRISIGRFEEKSGKLIPNENYWKYYGINQSIDIVTNSAETVVFEDFGRIKSVGCSFLAEKLLSNSGVEKVITDIFGIARSRLIIIAATHMLINGNVFEHVSDWCEENVLGKAFLTSSTSSSLFASITRDERMNFFKAWIGLNQSDKDYYAYDVTSFSTYAKGINDAEFGYNRDGEDLPQINLGCYFNQTRSLPMFYITYPGSIIDKSHLPSMMAHNKELNVDNVVFVMDKGFCSTSNLKYMRQAGYSFLMAVENRNKTISEAINKVREAITLMKNRIKSGVYGLMEQGSFYGINATLHIYYQPALAEQQRDTLLRTIEQQEYILSKTLALSQNEARKYRNYFQVNISSDGTFAYRRNYTAIEDKAKNCGFFCLITDLSINSEKAIAIYRRKDVIEKNFDDIKNHADMKRLRTHHGSTTDGKIFCSFLALIIIALLSNFLNRSEKTDMTKSDALAEIAKVRLLIAKDGQRLINPLTKTQKLIFEACGMDSEQLIEFIRDKADL